MIASGNSCYFDAHLDPSELKQFALKTSSVKISQKNQNKCNITEQFINKYKSYCITKCFIPLAKFKLQPTNLLLFVTSCICVINSASERSFALSQRVILTMLDSKNNINQLYLQYTEG